MFRKRNWPDCDLENPIKSSISFLLISVIIVITIFSSMLYTNFYRESRALEALDDVVVISKYEDTKYRLPIFGSIGNSIVPINGGVNSNYIIEINIDNNLYSVSVPVDTYDFISVNDIIKVKTYVYKDKLYKVEYLGKVE